MYKNYISEIYEKKFGNNDNLISLGWGNQKSQEIRFEILLNIGYNNEDTVLDVGCGFGDISTKINNYYGIDIRESVIKIAKTKYKKKFDCKNIFDINESFDWVISSGIFCFKLNWKKQTFSTIEKMWNLSRKGISINFLSDLSNGKRDDDMKFTKLDEILPLIKKLTNKFIIRHDYLPNDFTIYLYK